MHEWVLQLRRKIIELLLEVTFVVAGDQAHVVDVPLDLGLVVALLILLQELGKLLVIGHFLLLHRHDLLDVCLELSQVVHQHLLLLGELDDVCVVLGNRSIREI